MCWDTVSFMPQKEFSQDLYCRFSTTDFWSDELLQTTKYGCGFTVILASESVTYYTLFV